MNKIGKKTLLKSCWCKVVKKRIEEEEKKANRGRGIEPRWKESALISVEVMQFAVMTFGECGRKWNRGKVS